MKRERTFVDKRRNDIVNIIDSHSEISVEDLANNLNVSLVTIRRDLQYLEDRRKIKRVYGGAMSINRDGSDPKTYELKMYRTLIARYAASLVEDGDSLFINTSSNALELIQYVDKKNVVVITNNGKILNTDYPSKISVMLTGGELRHPKNALVGDYAVRNLMTVKAKKAFVGCTGISIEGGMTTKNANEVTINGLMIERVLEATYILADHTKIGFNSSFISCSIDKVTNIITDEKAPQEVINSFRERGIKVHQVRLGDSNI